MSKIKEYYDDLSRYLCYLLRHNPEGYRERFVCIGKSEEKKKVYRILTSPKFDEADIFDFVKKTGQVVDDRS